MKPEDMRVYKIYHAGLEQFWNGGAYGGWMDEGKVYSSHKGARAAISQMLRKDPRRCRETYSHHPNPFERSDLKIHMFQLSFLIGYSVKEKK